MTGQSTVTNRGEKVVCLVRFNMADLQLNAIKKFKINIVKNYLPSWNHMT